MDHNKDEKIDAARTGDWLYPGYVLKGEYVIERELKRGGIGAVYLARHRKILSRLVVIKILLPDVEASSSADYFKTKLLLEIEALGRIKHPGIVDIHHADETDEGRVFFVMEFIEGITLRTALLEMHQRGIEGMELERAANVMQRLGEAISVAHQAKIIHRDLKPENIMLHYPLAQGEQVKIIDFGIATVLDSQVAAYRSTTISIGTPAYMAPEQLMGKPEAASDIYALGVIAYEMLTTHKPFNTKSSVQQYEMQQKASMRRPQLLRPDLPERAEAVILKALAFNPNDRYRSARDFGNELSQALTAKSEPDAPLPSPGSFDSRLPTEDLPQVPPSAASGDTSVLGSKRGQSEETSARTLEVAHVLFMDLVGSRNLLTEVADLIMQKLEEIISETREYIRADENKELMTLDRGDGMVLVFFRDAEAPLRCAIEIATALQMHPEIKLRMGINSGTVFRRKGLSIPSNVTGTGMVNAERVMSCGDAGHILLSKTAAEFVGQIQKWHGCIHYLGEGVGKQGTRFELFNFYTDTVGNPEIPQKLKAPPSSQAAQEVSTPPPAPFTEIKPAAKMPPEPDLESPPISTPQAEPDLPPPPISEPQQEVEENQSPTPTPHPPLADKILTQILGVSHRQDSRGNEGLLYSLAPFDVEGDIAPPVMVRIRERVLQLDIEEVRKQIENLNHYTLAQASDKLNALEANSARQAFEAAANELARHALPERGFVGMMPAGIHPQFDIIPDAASQIPWEVLEESYFSCPRGHSFWSPFAPLENHNPHCGSCGTKMARVGGKLALTYHLTHLVRSQGWPVAQGNQFLIIQDPTGNLCSLDKDSGKYCARHLEEIINILQRQGYEINLIKEENATVAHVLKAMADEAVVGIYYFGHGFSPRGGDEGRLLLHDGFLYASQIEDIKPRAAFVFINACEGAAPIRDWDFEKRSSSVAEAFARGGRGRVVIASMWPMVNFQAAEGALEFFRNATPSTRLGEALRAARRMSYERYQTGVPHTVWMGLRYFGDLNKTLPTPLTAQAWAGAKVAQPTVARVFDDHRQLNAEVFAFAIDDVMLRAAKRRNLQHRARVTLTDFVAGLIRKGDLTRFALEQCGIDSDKLYKFIGSQTQSESSADAKAGKPDSTSESNLGEAGAAAIFEQENLDEAQIRAALAKWIVRDKEQFAADLVAALQRADEIAFAAEGSEDRRISEQDVLEGLLAGAEWAELAALGLPPADEIRRLLKERESLGKVDENGAIRLDALDEEARGVIETAHTLAQQRGVFPITNRLMLAALLAREEGFASRVCKIAEVRPKLLFALMIAAHKKSVPLSFGLSLEACERIVLPVIEEAQRKASGDKQITEGDLFRAFCEQAGQGLKDFLELPALGANLNRLKLIDPETRLDGDARQVLVAAFTMGQKLALKPIPNRLMLAAFLLNPQGHAARLLKRLRIPYETVCAQLIKAAGGNFQTLSAALKDEPPGDFELSVEAAEGVVKDMRKRASEIACEETLITEPILFQAYCDVADKGLKAALKQSPWRIDLDELGKELDTPPDDSEDDASGASSAGRNSRPSTPSSGSKPQSQRANREPEAAVDRSRFEDQSWRVIVESAQLAWQQGWLEIRTPHLFAAMIGDGSSPVGIALQQSHLNPEAVKSAVLKLVKPRQVEAGDAPTIKLGEHASLIVTRATQLASRSGRERVSEEDIFEAFFADGGGVVGSVLRQFEVQESGATPGAGAFGQTTGSSILSALGNDLTAKAARGELAEVVGRDSEIETAMETLQLTENANPLLVGEAGVGKTAIVEGIARRIFAGRCPQALANMRLIEVTAGALVANTRLRGEFEQRLQELLAEALGGVILFIDEIHTLVGAGAAGSGPDAGNMLKTALARGQLRLIGATTLAEYKQTIARDKALSRRFQMQMIHPPSREATIQVLTARQKALEQHHGVQITKAAKIAAVDLSGRFILDKQWPAKARDVLERACVLALSRRKGRRQHRAQVTLQHVATVVSRQTGIPLERVSASDRRTLATLEERLGKRIIGQPEALQTIANAIRRCRQGFAGEAKPWGIFLFVGAPGVGKTELAKVLAEEVFGDIESLIRFDMGEFSEAHSAAKLIGAPPGYVGYDQGAPLVERLRKRPYSLLLFDEIEHAHEDVLGVLLRLFSEGTIADADGNVADARNTLIILTSNLLGADEARQPGFAPDAKIPGEASQGALRSLLERHLTGKFIDRLDAIIKFNALTIDDMETVAQMMIAEITRRAFAIHKVCVETEPSVARSIAERAARESSGARAVQRAVDIYVAAPLGAILSGATLRAMQIRIRVSGGVIKVEPSPPVDSVNRDA